MEVWKWLLKNAKGGNARMQMDGENDLVVVSCGVAFIQHITSRPNIFKWTELHDHKYFFIIITSVFLFIKINIILLIITNSLLWFGSLRRELPPIFMYLLQKILFYDSINSNSKTRDFVNSKKIYKIFSLIIL